MKRVVYRVVPNYQDISTCYHEAGHIICSLLYLCEVSRAEVISSEEGLTYYDCPDIDNADNRSKNSLIRKEISIRYSGVLAENIFFQNLHPNDKMPIKIRIGASDDFKVASNIIKKYNVAKPGKPRQKYKTKIKIKTTKLLKSHWSDIALIANILLDKKSITYSKMKVILTKKSSKPKKWKDVFNKIEMKMSSR